ncbi:MAG: PhzF family phenazine biosynthesis protein [Thermodesulfobacteriota bacterium]
MKLYQIDAFTDQLFSGNPAAVCPLDDWLSDDLMQQIALENNLSETAFFVFRDGEYELRWFTPATEVDLCGHATLASAYVIFNVLNYDSGQIIFNTRSGQLVVGKQKDFFSMDFPSQPPTACEVPPNLIAALGVQPEEVLSCEDLLVVFQSQNDVEQLTPVFNLLKKIPQRGVIVTAPGNDADFVSRCFFPNLGINEDPVTGSAHCTLTPYWAKRLDKTELEAHQVSSRGGKLRCKIDGSRVVMYGQAVKYLEGLIEI